MTNPVKSFFSPRGVALIGTSTSPNKLSFGIIRNLIEGNYSERIFPVNPRHREVLGHPCYPTVGDVPGPVDLAVVTLPSFGVPNALEDCGKKGIKSVIIISGGFREIGDEGIKLENDCLAIASKYKMRLVGPNCVGIMDLYSGLNTTFIKGVPPKGHIGFLSQSGAICGAVVDYVMDKEIGFSCLVSLGNMADLNETDMIAHLAEDSNCKVIALYLEGLQDGRRFLDVCSKVTRKKPVVVLKVGRSNEGARAVSSHTGSLAGSHSAYLAAFDLSGVIAVNSAAELFDVSIGLVHQKPPASNRTVIITNSGGPAALASDSLADNGFSLTNLLPDTQTYLRSKLVSSAQVVNPVDMLGGADPSNYQTALKACIDDINVDSIVAIHTPQALVNPVAIAESICAEAEKTEKPVVSCFMGGGMVNEARHYLHKRGVPMYVFPESVGTVFGALYKYGQYLRRGHEFSELLEDVEKNLVHDVLLSNYPKTVLGEAQTRPLLYAYGIPICKGDFAKDAKHAADIAEKVGYPVVLKIVSDQILHKSEVGGVMLNINTRSQVSASYTKMTNQIKRINPQARIDGVLVEKMAPKGYEIIIGMKRDPNFGPILMFGLGGIYVELIFDVAFEIAPITKSRAFEMIQRTKAGQLLKGLRGLPSADVDAVIDCILRLSQLSMDHHEISEIEVNPLIVLPNGKGAIAIDARAICTW